MKKMMSVLTGFTDFQKDCLKSHNDYRTAHNVEPLKLSSKLCSHSQEWAEHLASISKMEHRSNSKYGENIYYFYSSDPNRVVGGKDAVSAWYAEIKDHTFHKEPKSMNTGHFTQVVWADSKELGVGVSKNSKGQTFVVCNYDPPGNYQGTYGTKVPPVGGFSK